MSARTSIALLAWVVILANGCLMLPIPAPHKVLKGKPVTQDQLAFLTPESTTKHDVIARLGTPDVIWQDANVFAYNWVVRDWMLAWMMAVPAHGNAGIDDIPKRYVLLIQFDGEERLQRFETVVWPHHRSYGDVLKEWVSTF